MSRPKIPRYPCCRPCTFCFKPQNSRLGKEEVLLERDELGALKLYDFDNLNEKKASLKMKVSQPTFARILQKAHQKVATALIYGKTIRIKKE